MNGRQAHRSGTLFFSLAMILIGLALIGQIIGGTGSVISPRLLLGILFLAAGAGRTYIELRRGRDQ
jgi:hypothetical protein